MSTIRSATLAAFAAAVSFGAAAQGTVPQLADGPGLALPATTFELSRDQVRAEWLAARDAAAPADVVAADGGVTLLPPTASNADRSVLRAEAIAAQRAIDATSAMRHAPDGDDVTLTEAGSAFTAVAQRAAVAGPIVR